MFFILFDDIAARKCPFGAIDNATLRRGTTSLPATRPLAETKNAEGRSISLRRPAAKAAAGHGDKLFHDLRRTPIREMVAPACRRRSSRTVFDLYDIASEKDRERSRELTEGDGLRVQSGATILLIPYAAGMEQNA